MNETCVLTGLPGKQMIGHPVDDRRRLRAARLHRDRPDLGAARLEHLAHHLEGALRDAAGGQDQVAHGDRVGENALRTTPESSSLVAA